MVWKEMIICDICGNEIVQKRRGVCSEITITMHKETAKALGLKGISHPRRGHYGRRRFFSVTVDTCSRGCFTKMLEEVKEAIPNEE